MPELPEVETVRRLLEQRVVGKTISDIDVYREKNVDGDVSSFVSLLRGKTVEKVLRKAKVLAFSFSEGLYVTSHLRMEGKYFFFEQDAPREKHDILRFRFTDGTSLVYNDVRKFGHLELFDEEGFRRDSSFARLGPEPFDIGSEELYAKLKKKHIPIKEAIMDQSLISGIGNIYADESLFAAKIHPLTPANRLTELQVGTLLNRARKILQLALSAGGSTIRSYHPSKGMDGLFQFSLKAYGKEGQPCPDCGAPMKKIFVGGRGTTFCPVCQKDPTKPFVLGVTGPIHSGKSTVSKFYESKGDTRFDADQVAKDAYKEKGIRRRIVALLGEESYEGEEPNLAHIRSVVAEHPAKKDKLEAIIHPYVIKKAQQLIRKTKPMERIVLDVPLLFSSGMDSLCDATILVLAPLESRVERIRQEGRDVDRLIKINAGYPLDKAKKKAGVIVDNDAGLDELYQKLDALPF